MRAATEAPVSPAEVSSDRQEHLVLALRAAYRAFQKTSIYPPGHPAVPQTLSESVEHFDRALEQGPVVIAAAPRHLRADGVELAESTGALRALSQLLHELDLAAVELDRGLDAEELERFVRALGRARGDALRGTAVAGLIEELGLERVRVLPLDYSALSFAEGPREGGPDTPDVWDGLLARLTEGGVGDIQLELLAQQVGEQIRQQSGAGVAALRTRLRRANSGLAALEPARREELRRRLTRFVAALNPDLRGDLLRVDAKRAADSVETLTDLAEIVPEPELLDALQEVDRAGGRVPESVLTLMNKLVRLSGERPALGQGLTATLQRWGVSPATLAGDTPDLRSALAEVFRSRTEIDCNPDTYQALLDDLSRVQLEQSAVPLESRYRDPRDAEDVRLHAAEIAALVLGRAGGEKYRAGLLGYIDAAGEQILERQSFWVLRDAAVAARSYTLLSDQPADTLVAATRYLNEFTEPERVTRILEAACRAPRIPEEALSLLGLGGDNALEGALDRLDREQRPEVAEVLARFVAESGRDGLTKLIESRTADGWHRLRPVFRVLRGMSAELVLPLLRGLGEHDDWRVRREVVLVACVVDGRSGATEQRLRAALADSDLRVGLAAVDQLAKQSSSQARELLGDFLRGWVRNTVPHPAVAGPAVRALAGAGLHGIDQLCRTLDDMRWAAGPARVTIARLVLAALGAVPDSVQAERSVRRWKWSVIGMLARWVAHLRARRAARK